MNLFKKPFSIRLAQPQDLSRVAELEILAIQDLCQEYDNKEQAEFLSSKNYRRTFWDEIVFVAENKDRIVGFASLLICRQIVGNIYVEPKFSRRGIGTQLLNAVEEEAIRRKVKTLQVTSCIEGKPFYVARGYEKIAECNLWQMDLILPCITMKKELVFTRQKRLSYSLVNNIS